MDSQIRALLAAGAADSQKCLGTPALMYRDGEEIWSGSLVWVETSGSYAVELGGAMYTVTARATLPVTAMQEAPLPGDRIQVNGRLCMVVSVFRSAYDAAYNLEATTLK